MDITVRAFAVLRERLGADSRALSVPDGTRADEVFRQLFPDSEEARWSKSLLVAVNRELAPPSTVLRDGDEVAFLPPLGGGSGARDRRVSIGVEPLNVEPLLALVQGPSRGGVAIFLGTVRDQFQGRPVLHLDYEAYPEMALQEMSRLCDEVEGRWPGTAIAIAHRTGRLDLGECAVIVAAASPHRADAFAACRHGIDELKVRVPIWKREVFQDGSEWRENPRDR